LQGFLGSIPGPVIASPAFSGARNKVLRALQILEELAKSVMAKKPIDLSPSSQELMDLPQNLQFALTLKAPFYNS
jgi:hypothetical protein